MASGFILFGGVLELFIVGVEEEDEKEEEEEEVVVNRCR